MKITVAQLNPEVGDIEGNLSKLVQEVEKASEEKSDLVVFPELFITGYPPRDLLEYPFFLEQVEKAVNEIIRMSKKIFNTGIIFGAPCRQKNSPEKGIYNSAFLVYRGEPVHIQHKSLLPTYDVFDETRYFNRAVEINPVAFKDEVLGISICEDAWNHPDFWPQKKSYTIDPITVLADRGATILINISASPFNAGKEEVRYRLISDHATKLKLPFLYVNQVGGNDELVFDGRSMFIAPDGKCIELLPAFKEEVSLVDTKNIRHGFKYSPLDPIESIYGALVLGIKDYMKKCGFKKTLIGLSGGIDSSVTACLAAAAAGRENVLGVAMPSPFSSRESLEDAQKLARNLGISFMVIKITGIYNSYLETMEKPFAGLEKDITEENIQARIRGNLLMALSNKFGHLVLSTGNKSELAVGYCTMYGDMSGGLAVISDVPKTMVYQLAEFINREGEIIPQRVLEKPPSAELKPDQKDQDTLPPYPVLDRILYHHIEERLSVRDIVKKGFDKNTVEWVVKNVAKNEYKRKQAAPGLKITTKAFGTGRRMPLAARYML